MPVAIGIQNLTGSAITIQDMGISIPGSTILILTSVFTPDQLRSSDSLLTRINNNEAVIYDGSSSLSKTKSLEFMSGTPIGTEAAAITSVASSAAAGASPAIVGTGTVLVISGSNTTTISGALPVQNTYFFAESAAQSSTTSSTFQQKLRLTASVVTGTYKLEWYYEFNNSSVSSNFLAQIQENDSVTLMSHTQEVQDGASNQTNQAHGFAIRSLTGGTYNFDLDYAAVSSNTSRIQNARLFLQRLA
jgi:hypothetical protein